MNADILGTCTRPVFIFLRISLYPPAYMIHVFFVAYTSSCIRSVYIYMFGGEPLNFRCAKLENINATRNVGYGPWL
jgi:hypothetical protein